MGYLKAPIVAGGGEAVKEEGRGFLGRRGGDGDITVSGTRGSGEGFGILRESYGCHVECKGAGFSFSLMF